MSGQFLIGLFLSLLFWGFFFSCLELLEEGRWTVEKKIWIKTCLQSKIGTFSFKDFEIHTNNRLASCFIITFPVPAFLSDHFRVVMLWFLSCAIVHLVWGQTVWSWLFLGLEMQTNLLYFFILQSLHNRHENLLVFFLSGGILACLIFNGFLLVPLSFFS